MSERDYSIKSAIEKIERESGKKFKRRESGVEQMADFSTIPKTTDAEFREWMSEPEEGSPDQLYYDRAMSRLTLPSSWLEHFDEERRPIIHAAIMVLQSELVEGYDEAARRKSPPPDEEYYNEYQAALSTLEEFIKEEKEIH